MSRTSAIIRFIAIISSFALIIGCSGIANNSISTDINDSISFTGNHGDFPDVSNSPIENPTRQTESFEISTPLKNSIESLNNKSNRARRFDVIPEQGAIRLKNNGRTVYDTRIVVENIYPPELIIAGLDNLENNISGIDFGIIPSGMTTASRKIQIPSGVLSIKAHIEYRENPNYERGELRLHSSPFRDRITPSHTTKAIVPDSILIGCSSGLESVYPVLLEHGLFLDGLIEPLKLYKVRITDNRNPYDLINVLDKDARIHHAEVESVLFPSYFPNDPIYDPSQPEEYRWAYKRINAVKTWDYFSDGLINDTGNASVTGIVFAILDTGITYHNDLNLDSFDRSLINTYGKNFVSPGQPITDTDGHGTAVAGIMGAMGNNAIGMAGMAWNPLFLPVKVFATSNEYGQVGPLFALLQGLMYVRDIAGIAPTFKFIVNMSLGGYEQTPSFWTTEAINQVSQRQNIILISGCGNDKNDKNFAGVSFTISADNYYPAALEKVVSVGASSWTLVSGRDREVYQEDSYNWGTNWGLSVDLCAPGSLSIYTTSHTSPTAYNQYFGGTSASCAFVSGLAALSWAKNPSWTKDKVISNLKTSCDIMWLPSSKIGKLGYGRINAFRTIKGLKPEAYINDVHWTRSGNPIFGDAIHVSGDGLFVDNDNTPGPNDYYNFRWYIDGNFVIPAAVGRETMILRLTPGFHTLHFRVWNKGQEWNFADPRHFSNLVQWPNGIQIDNSDLPSDYYQMIYIPASDFTMGCGPTDPGYTNPGSDDEKPQHVHYVGDFWVRKYEVTNLEFQNFIEAGGYNTEYYWEPEGWQVKTQNNWTNPLYWSSGDSKGGNPIDFPQTAANPVCGISWWEADAFTKWIGHKLPIEAQWEKAARGTENNPPRTYPWGMDWIVENSNHNTDTTTPVATARVGTYSPRGDSPYGLCDSAGNVWEWCWEWYDATIYTKYQQGDYSLPETGVSKCCRGGGYIYDGSWVSRCSSRYSTAIPSTTRNGEIGLRPIHDGG